MAIKLRDDSKIPVKVMFLGKDGTGKERPQDQIPFCPKE